MAHNEITFDDGFHQTSFIDSLEFITHDVAPTAVLTPTTLEAALAADTNSGTFNIAVFSGFLSQYTQAGGKTFTDWPGFAADWLNYVNVEHVATTGFTLSGTTNLYNLLKNTFREGTVDSWATNPGEVANGAVNPDADFAILTTSPNPITIDYNAQNTTNPVFNALNHFLKGFDYTNPTGGTVTLPTATAEYTTNFISQLTAFFTTASIMQDPSLVPSANPTYLQLPSYEAIYMAFGPTPFDRNAFIADLKTFYNDQVAANGYFIPSQAFGEWMDTVRQGNLAVARLAGSSSLAGNSSEKAIILDRVLRLLIKIISTLQDVGIAQANRLKFITQYQQAYTSLQTQIPTFVRDPNSPIGGNDDKEKDTRNTLNTQLNGIFADNLRALRGLQEDTGKKLQTNVNQTNDAVNQQTDMATTFIQQLSSLLTAILR